jgi:hypothetical protein
VDNFLSTSLAPPEGDLACARCLTALGAVLRQVADGPVDLKGAHLDGAGFMTQPPRRERNLLLVRADGLAKRVGRLTSANTCQIVQASRWACKIAPVDRRPMGKPWLPR